MEWNTETSRTWLLRIIALLLSLADLAEQASLQSWSMRRRVLAILRPGEEAAYRSVAKAAREFGAPIPANAIVAAGEWMAAGDGDDPEDAMRLALRFRALAIALAFVLTQAGWLASRNSSAIGEIPPPVGKPAKPRHDLAEQSARRNLRTLKPPDLP